MKEKTDCKQKHNLITSLTIDYPFLEAITESCIVLLCLWTDLLCVTPFK